MVYAILQSGGKQYRVKPGDVIDVEKLPVEEGSSIELADVLAVFRDGEVSFGSPLLPDASVLAEVKGQGKDKKIIVFKYKRKVRYRRKKGHRQRYTRLAITAILLGGEEIGVDEKPEVEVVDELQDELTAEEPAEEVDEEPLAPLVEEPEDKEEKSEDEPPGEEGPGEDEPVIGPEDKPLDEVEVTDVVEAPAEVTEVPPKARRKRPPAGGKK